MATNKNKSVDATQQQFLVAKALQKLRKPASKIDTLKDFHHRDANLRLARIRIAAQTHRLMASIDRFVLATLEDRHGK
jgi:hypothetical protein